MNSFIIITWHTQPLSATAFLLHLNLLTRQTFLKGFFVNQSGCFVPSCTNVSPYINVYTAM